MLACHAGDPGPIPGQCIVFFTYVSIGVRHFSTRSKTVHAVVTILPFLVERAIEVNILFFRTNHSEILHCFEDFVHDILGFRLRTNAQMPFGFFQRRRRRTGQLPVLSGRLLRGFDRVQRHTHVLKN